MKYDSFLFNDVYSDHLIEYIITESRVWIKLNSIKDAFFKVTYDVTRVVCKTGISTVTGASLCPGCGKSLYTPLDQLHLLWDCYDLQQPDLNSIYSYFKDLGLKTDNSIGYSDPSSFNTVEISDPDTLTISLDNGCSATIPMDIVRKLVLDYLKL